MDTKIDFSVSELDIYVVGAGAIGRVITGLLHKYGYNPTLVARDKTISSLRKSDGYNLITNDTDITQVQALTLTYPEIRDLSARNLSIIFYATKASYLAEAVSHTRVLAGANTHHVFLQGGIPWWFGYSLDTRNVLAHITDPDSRILSNLGGVQNAHAGMIKFGAALENETAELKGNGDFAFASVSRSEQNDAICHLLKGVFTFDPPLVKPSVITTDIKQTVWTKAAGSFAMSAYAMITGGTLGQMFSDDKTCKKMVDVAKNIMETGEHIGIHQAAVMDWESYFFGIARSKPNHMMSITKDPSEIKQIIELPIEIRRACGLDTCLMDEVFEQIPDRFKTAENNPNPQISVLERNIS